MTTSAVSRLGRSPEEGIKAPCLTSTTTQIELSGTGQTLNGVVTSTSDRVIVKDQILLGENGIYIVGADAWERATDMNASEDVDNGQLVVDANTSVLYQIAVTGIWAPGNDMTFVVFLSGMPGQISLTNSNAVDLVDIDVPLVLGSLTPAASQHLEFDFQSVQSKSNNTTASVLFLNPLGGDVNILDNLVIGGLVDGVDIAAHAALFVAHVADATIHFTEGSIDHANILSIGTNSHAQIDTHIADATLHFTEASIDHTAILNIGSNDHAAIDTHIADATIHFTQAAISITASQVSDFETAVSANASVAANTAKVTNATHSGQVDGATALTLNVTAVTAQPASGVVIGADTMIINDGGVLSEVTLTQLATFFSSGASHTLIMDADGDTQIQVEEAADEDIIRFDVGDNVTGFPALADALIFSAGQFTLTLPTANVAATTGAAIDMTAGDGNTTGEGGAVSINAGAGDSSQGGNATLRAGHSTVLGNGGAARLRGGNAAGASNDGGRAWITGGFGAGTGDGGIAQVLAGPSGNGATGDGGLAEILAGTSLATDGAGGEARVNSGAGKGTGSGGAVTLIVAAAGLTGVGGAVNITAGAGGLTSGAGGPLNITSGAAVAGADFDGGVLNIISGAGFGAGVAGAININPGSAGLTGPGADVTIRGGAGAGAGHLQLAGGAGTGTSEEGGQMFIDGGQGAGPAGLGGITTVAGGRGGNNAAGAVLRLRGGGGGSSSGNGANVEISGGAGDVEGEIVLQSIVNFPDTAVPASTPSKLYAIAGKLIWDGAPVLGFTVVTETTTARTAVAFECVLVDDDTAAGVVTITLPVSVLGDQIVVKKLGTTADVIVDGDTAETIDGALTFTLTAQYASVTLIADGAGWNII